MKIAHFGTFDVNNYGDLLFPLLIERRLGGEMVEFVHVSPVGGAPDLPDCKPVIGFEAALAECESWDAIVLGGGALGHGDSAGEVEKYRDPEIHTIAYPGGWLLPALIAQFRGIPVIWNAPGIPGDFSEERKRRLLQWAGWQVDYLAVRDAASANVLRESLVEATVVPDTAVEVSQLWSEADLQSEIERLRERADWPRSRYLALHFNERYAGSDLPSLGEEVRKICAAREAGALLIAIGVCHGDVGFAHRVREHLGDAPVSILVPDSLRSVAAAIRFSEGYIGSSLHGAITAASFSRPFLIVASDSRPKFAGFLQHLGAPQLQVANWADAAAAATGWESRAATKNASESLRPILDQHWHKVSATLGIRRPVPAQVGAQLIEMLSGFPPEWFPLIALLERAPLFAPVFESHAAIWATSRRQLQNSAFVAAAAHRRLDQRHQRLLFDMGNLQAKLEELRTERQTLRDERQQLLAQLKDAKTQAQETLQEQRRALEEKLQALNATIQRRDGRIEALQEERRALEERLNAHRTTLEERGLHIAALTEKQGAFRTTIEKRDEQISALQEKVSGLTDSLREREARFTKLRQTLEEGLRDAETRRANLRETFEEKVNGLTERLREADTRAAKLRQTLGQLERKMSAEIKARAAADESVQKARKDLARVGKWSERILQDFQRILRSRRWRLGCWLSLKSAGDESKEARRLAHLIASRPQPSSDVRKVAPLDKTPPAASSPAPKSAPAASAKKPARPAPKAVERGGRFVSIVIPVYNAHDDLVRCLESVRRHTRPDHPVIMIDDASPDERIWPLLQEWEKQQPNFRAIRNQSNLGYTATVNRGCELASPGDIILLNSDTMVPPRWVEQLAACAYSRPRVATVTAISNAAGAFSVPKNNEVNSLPPGWEFEEMADFVARTSQRLRPVVPTGNGFCLYLTRAARAAVGPFDAENFPNGYGEENDYCLRAAAAGLVNLIDDATYVFHRRSASFGEKKAEILKTSRAVLDQLHPDYTERIREWSRADPLDPVREEMQRKLERIVGEGSESVLPNDDRPTLLFVLHDGKGGTRFTSEDLSEAVAWRYRVVILRTAIECWTVYENLDTGLVPVRRYDFAETWQVDRPLTSDRLAALREICADYRVGLAHVRHLLASGPELLDVLHELKVPIVFSFHDFYAVCPTIQLLDETQTYCAGHCTAGAGDCPLPENWFRPPLPWLKHRYVHEHQQRMATALQLCDRCVTTSEASRDLITEHFPALADGRFSIIEHGRDLPRLELARPPAAGQPLRVIFFGAFNPAKGIGLVLQLLERNRAAGHPIELHILGQKSRGFDPEPLGAIYHGPYERDELAERVRAIGPAISLVPSLWPETYCHVLTESWTMGLPVLASDIGTLRERVQRHGGGWLLPVGNAERWFEKLCSLARDRQGYETALQEVRAMTFPDVAAMAREYEKIYAQLLPERASQPVAQPDVVFG